MIPDILPLIKSNSDLVDWLEDSEDNDIIRFYPFNAAIKQTDLGTPYCVWQVVSGSPLNSLTCPPGMDNVNIQIDCYAYNAEDCLEVMGLVREALEEDSIITHFLGTDSDPDTHHYRCILRTSWWIERNV